MFFFYMLSVKPASEWSAISATSNLSLSLILVFEVLHI